MLLQQIAVFLISPIQLTVALILIGNLIGYAVWSGAGTFFGVILLEGLILIFLVRFQEGITMHLTIKDF
jgi:multidrug transporter EmrE-like cation transporter